MSALALSGGAMRLPLIDALLTRQRPLALFGLAALALAPLTGLLQLIDPRLLDGESLWLKPTKFLVSIGLFALTSAWLHGLVDAAHRDGRVLRWTAWALIAAAGFELVYIVLTAAAGVQSHFNADTPFFAAMFAMMGRAALVLVGTALPLAWQIARHPAPGVPTIVAAASVIGLTLTFVLGAATGFAMGAAGGHDIGPRTASLPLFGWSLTGGDLRVAHFLGLHVQQALPLLGLVLAARPASRAWPLLALGTAAYVGLTAAAFVQARAGLPVTSVL